jgi:dihydrofolate synthase / folylpolyglutamate synthase
MLQKLFFKAPSKKTTRHVVADITASRMRYFREIVDRYGKRSTKFIHVAGSKGKGSTVEYISSALRSEGYKVGIFTSPHLHTARERVKINDNLISRKDLLLLGEWALSDSQDWSVFFDLLLAIALRYFLESNVDFIVLETGLGGRYDSTNFLLATEISIITSISLDHQSILGNTIEEIAYQKAGIIKRDGILVTSELQQASVLDVIKKECLDMNAKCILAPISNSLVTDNGFTPSHNVQIENLCVALCALKILGIDVKGMSQFYWPCRMEHFIVEGVDVILDGSHNEDSVKQFIQGVKHRYPNRPVYLIFGGGHEKNLDSMLRVVVRDSDGLVLTVSSHFRSASEEVLKSQMPLEGHGKLIKFDIEDFMILDDNGRKGNVGICLMNTIAYINKERKQSFPPILAICGSLFVTAEAREKIFELYPELFSLTDWVRSMDPML